MTDMAGDDWGDVFNEKELAELNEMFSNISLHIATDGDDRNEYLQVTILAPIDRVDILVTEMFQVTQSVQVGPELDEFMKMFGRGMLWQFMVERPDTHVDPDVVEHFLGGWEPGDDDDIEFY